MVRFTPFYARKQYKLTKSQSVALLTVHAAEHATSVSLIIVCTSDSIKQFCIFTTK